jgi:hypothetical protein
MGMSGKDESSPSSHDGVGGVRIMTEAKRLLWRFDAVKGLGDVGSSSETIIDADDRQRGIGALDSSIAVLQNSDPLSFEGF